MRLRIYVDTSVVGGCEDDEFWEHSIRLMKYFATGKFVLVLSDLTVQELAAAPEEVRSHLGTVPEQHIEVLQLDAEAKELAEAYIAEGVIMERMRADAQHIVNLYRIHGYNSVNLRRGYPTLEIRAPREILPDE
ncbi:MAG TPA: PIN domain protein [Thermoanaerobaculia bacterium]